MGLRTTRFGGFCRRGASPVAMGGCRALLRCWRRRWRGNATRLLRRHRRSVARIAQPWNGIPPSIARRCFSFSCGGTDGRWLDSPRFGTGFCGPLQVACMELWLLWHLFRGVLADLLHWRFPFHSPPLSTSPLPTSLLSIEKPFHRATSSTSSTSSTAAQCTLGCLVYEHHLHIISTTHLQHPLQHLAP